MMLLVILIHDN